MRLALAACVFGLAFGCAVKSDLPPINKTYQPPPPQVMLAITKADAKTYAGGLLIEWQVPDHYLICTAFELEPTRVVCWSVYTLRSQLQGTKAQKVAP